jgi:DNA-binding LacI/PurR family transcriptional regulator
VTIKDIAARAGVSKTTVSFALNEPSRISAETRSRVLAVIAELGYEPDSVARALATKRLGALGLLLPQPLPEALANPYLCELMRGIGKVCEDRGLVLTMLPPILGRAEEAARRAAVDALLTIGIGPGTEVMDILARRHLPFVTIDGADKGPASNVGIDDEAAAEILMDHILELGHRRIGILQLSPERYSRDDGTYSPVSQRRLSGFRRAFERSALELGGPESPAIVAEGSYEGGGEAVERLLGECRHAPTAIVAMADIVALGAIATLAQMGYAVPGDISVAGFDDIPLSSRMRPSLTTVRQPGFEKGYAAALLVLELLDGGSPASRVLPTELLRRDSTAVPPAAMVSKLPGAPHFTGTSIPVAAPRGANAPRSNATSRENPATQPEPEIRRRRAEG